MDNHSITVYCDGPDDGQHERYVVIRYIRLADDVLGHDWIPVETFTDANERVRRARRHVVHQKRGRIPSSRLEDAGIPHVHYQYRFHCPRCGFDERRNDTTHLEHVFDLLAANDVHEISIRALARYAWPPRRG